MIIVRLAKNDLSNLLQITIKDPGDSSCQIDAWLARVCSVFDGIVCTKKSAHYAY